MGNKLKQINGILQLVQHCLQCFGTVGCRKSSDKVLTGVVICLQQGAHDLHMVQLTPLPPNSPLAIEIQNNLPFCCRLIN